MASRGGAPRRAHARARGAARLRDEQGAGAALALGIAAAVLLLGLLVVGAGTASIAQARASASADAAALAAADALAGYADGSPCGLAQAVAAASGARLAACLLDGLDARVTTAVPVGPLTASATAIAGPPAGRAP